jgi:hypothetical protein
MWTRVFVTPTGVCWGSLFLSGSLSWCNRTQTNKGRTQGIGTAAAMPLYYIDVRSRFGVDEDCDGVDLPDLAAARAEVLKVGHRLVERWAEMPPDARAEIIIEVIDERLKYVLRVSLPEIQQGLFSG